MTITHQISSSCTGAEWNTLTQMHPINWSKATDVLRDRIEERFLNACDVLEGRRSEPFGFAILAIDFAVAETTQAFREGRESHSGHSKRLCIAFIKALPDLMSCTTIPPDQESCATQVYEKVRCAIHHSASTDPGVRVKVSGDLFEFSGGNLVAVNRRKFHAAVKREFRSYLRAVVNDRQGDLQKNFMKKMNDIARI